jgi:hypothetical protein
MFFKSNTLIRLSASSDSVCGHTSNRSQIIKIKSLELWDENFQKIEMCISLIDNDDYNSWKTSVLICYYTHYTGQRAALPPRPENSINVSPLTWWGKHIEQRYFWNGSDLPPRPCGRIFMHMWIFHLLTLLNPWGLGVHDSFIRVIVQPSAILVARFW